VQYFNQGHGQTLGICSKAQENAINNAVPLSTSINALQIKINVSEKIVLKYLDFQGLTKQTPVKCVPEINTG
jgi:hypothetical protein